MYGRRVTLFNQTGPDTRCCWDVMDYNITSKQARSLMTYVMQSHQVYPSSVWLGSDIVSCQTSWERSACLFCFVYIFVFCLFFLSWHVLSSNVVLTMNFEQGCAWFETVVVSSCCVFDSFILNCSVCWHEFEFKLELD